MPGFFFELTITITNILSMPNLLFTKEDIALLQAQELLGFEDSSSGIYLRYIKSPARGSGYGTKMIRYIVKLSLDRGYGGNICLDAAWSSHLFYLYMGMIPIDQEPYVRKTYGAACEDAIEQLIICNNNEHNFQRLERITRDLLKFMFGHETNQPISKITDSVIWEQRELFSDLKARTVSYLRRSFIPNLLRILQENIGNKYPDTSWLSPIRMRLSEEGQARWIDAIDNDSEFETFKAFEHLRAYMTEEQQQQLESILAENACINAAQVEPERTIGFFSSSRRTSFISPSSESELDKNFFI